MKDLTNVKYFDTSEKLVDILSKKTQNPEQKIFFRVLVAYYFSKIASSMRTNIRTHDRGIIPINLYAINLAPSGFGKGFSTNIIEEQVISLFREDFLNKTFIKVSDKSLAELAVKLGIKYDIDPDEALEKCVKDFSSLGKLLFSFDSATTAAVKQMRQKLLMASAGSVNFEMDEIGSNLLGNIDVLSTFLELFDVGKVKQKLTKNTQENKRVEEIEGRTPANMMLFGTPAKLLNGGKAEDELISMLEIGMARRCLFGLTGDYSDNHNMSPEQIYDMMVDKSTIKFIDDLSLKLKSLADMTYFNTTLNMSKTVSLLLIEYQLDCADRAKKLREHDEILKAEIIHRYYKALKLAGAYAFIDESLTITEEHLYSAIRLVEDSGTALTKILTRERNYVKLAKYIASVGKELTQVDLVEDLPFYKGGESQRKELMSLAIAYGYRNNIVIKQKFSEGIEFFQGESLKVTDINKLTISYGKHLTEAFRADLACFTDLHKVVTLPGYNYTAHHFEDGYRHSEKVIEGFNLVMIDIDDLVSLETAKLLLEGYKCLFATTKSHTEANNRFRIIMPLTHTLKLNTEVYAKFMENVYEWLPFEIKDTQVKDIARKWTSHKGIYCYTEGKSLDALLFIPETKKADEQARQILNEQGLSNLERWFHKETTSGNRSNNIIKYALALVDNKLSIDQIRTSVFKFNGKLKNKLSDEEINNTIMVSVIKAVTKRDS